MRHNARQHLEATTRARIVASGEDGFAFQINALRVIVSWGGGWEHASVSIADRCPTWNEMQFIKTLLWTPNECVVQFHPPEAEYVNCHEHCLHLWRPTNADIPRPPTWMVGPQTAAEAARKADSTTTKP